MPRDQDLGPSNTKVHDECLKLSGIDIQASSKAKTTILLARDMSHTDKEKPTYSVPAIMHRLITLRTRSYRSPLHAL